MNAEPRQTGQTLTFTVPGEPVAKARPRTVRVTEGGKTHTYTPTATTSYEHSVRTHALRATMLQGWRRPKEDDRFHVTIELHLSDFRRKDIDNIAKSIFDGLKPVVMVDDWQVSSTYVTRILGELEPSARIVVERVAERVVRRSKRPHGGPGARAPHSFPPSEARTTPSGRSAGRLRPTSGGRPS